MYRSLIIDDERAVHIVIKKLGKWQESGILPPQSAKNGTEGLTMMRNLRPAIVFVDMNMPVMDGSSFLYQASKEFPHAKFIVVSGYDDFRYAKAALQAHVLDYILKPVAGNELNRVITHAVKLLNVEGMYSGQEIQSFTPRTLPPAIKGYLEKNYADDITLDELAKQFLFTKEYLSRLFREKYGYGICEYLQEVRMLQAKKLLENRELQILQIAAMVGYNDSNYFSKAFRTFYSISPSGYRNSITPGIKDDVS